MPSPRGPPADLADVGSAESMLAVALAEQPGALLRLLSTASEEHPGMDITECNYRRVPCAECSCLFPDPHLIS